MSSTPGLALLIVDDDARIRELAAAAAQRTGLYTSIATAETGSAAVQLLVRDSAQPPDLVLTDLSMPDMDGLELTRAIRADARWSHVPVVMFSSSDRPNDREDAIGAGCLAFFEKPGSFAGLQTLLAGLPDLIARSAVSRRR
jgi:CheY-like chemotaxis protein